MVSSKSKLNKTIGGILYFPLWFYVLDVICQSDCIYISQAYKKLNISYVATYHIFKKLEKLDLIEQVKLPNSKKFSFFRVTKSGMELGEKVNGLIKNLNKLNKNDGRD